MVITTIIENTSKDTNLTVEHGLSFYAQTNNKDFLVDTGASTSFLSNLKSLGIEVKNIKKMVLSHNHYDHGGGICDLLSVNKDIEIYCSSKFKRELFSKREYGYKQIDITSTLENNLTNLKLVEDIFPIFENVFICTIKKINKIYSCKDDRLKEKINGEFIEDNFTHEVYIAVIENDEIKIISPCSHSGFINIVEDAKGRFKDYKVTAFIGGLHIINPSENKLTCDETEIKRYAKYAHNNEIKLFTCHCTGIVGFELLNRYNKNIKYISTGDKVEV